MRSSAVLRSPHRIPAFPLRPPGPPSMESRSEPSGRLAGVPCRKRCPDKTSGPRVPGRLPASAAPGCPALAAFRAAARPAPRGLPSACRTSAVSAARPGNTAVPPTGPAAGPSASQARPSAAARRRRRCRGHRDPGCDRERDGERVRPGVKTAAGTDRDVVARGGTGRRLNGQVRHHRTENDQDCG